MEHAPPFLPETPETAKQDLVAALIMRNRKLLMVYNIKHGLRLEPPGGKTQPHEQGVEGFRNAVRREVREELGMSVTILSLVGVYPTDTPEGRFEVWMYACESEDEPQPECEPDKIGHFEWMNADELRALAAYVDRKGSHLMVPNMRKVLDVILPLL